MQTMQTNKVFLALIKYIYNLAFLNKKKLKSSVNDYPQT